MTSTIAISMGDPNGIGPEIILKSAAAFSPGQSISVVYGHEGIFRYYKKALNLDVDLNVVDHPKRAVTGRLNIINCVDFSDSSLQPGSLSAQGGLASMIAVEHGIKACMSGDASALVTAPISKEAITLAGYDVPGHTEFLAQKTDTDHVLMMLVSGEFRVALATIHIPLRKVAKQITPERLRTNLRILNRSLSTDFGIKKPNVAVLGLNPHAGDGGVIGNEEIDVIEPVIKTLNSEGLKLSGPFAADGFFGKALHQNFDAIFATYHDQGLIPFKALTFGKGVNFTAGLPIIRTSPDHGTAFGIAGKNAADPGSFSSAFELALTLSQRKTEQNPST